MMPQDVGEIWQYERHHQKMIVIVINFEQNIYSQYYAFCNCYIIFSQNIPDCTTGQFKKLYLSNHDGWKKTA